MLFQEQQRQSDARHAFQAVLEGERVGRLNKGLNTIYNGATLAGDGEIARQPSVRPSVRLSSRSAGWLEGDTVIGPGNWLKSDSVPASRLSLDTAAKSQQQQQPLQPAPE